MSGRRDKSEKRSKESKGERRKKPSKPDKRDKRARPERGDERARRHKGGGRGQRDARESGDKREASRGHEQASEQPLLLYGVHAVQGLLDERAGEIEELWVVEEARGRQAHLAKQARASGVLVRYRPRLFLDKQLPGKPHQNVIAKIRTFVYADADDLIQPPTPGCGPLLFLVGVQDPGNLGALLRSAKAFGASGVLLGRRETCGVTSAVSKAAAGAAAQLPIAQVHVQQAVKALRDAGWWLLGMHLEGESIEAFDLQRPTVFLLGAEGKGLKPSVQKHCDATLRIPMVAGWDSLNVSVSGGIALYEWRRQAGAGVA